MEMSFLSSVTYWDRAFSCFYVFTCILLPPLTCFVQLRVSVFLSDVFIVSHVREWTDGALVQVQQCSECRKLSLSILFLESQYSVVPIHSKTTICCLLLLRLFVLYYVNRRCCTSSRRTAARSAESSRCRVSRRLRITRTAAPTATAATRRKTNLWVVVLVRVFVLRWHAFITASAVSGIIFVTPPSLEKSPSCKRKLIRWILLTRNQ